MKFHPLIPTAKAFRSTLFCALLLAGAESRSVAQTTVYNASYDANGAALTTGTFTLNTFTVMGIYTSNSATTEAVYVTDGTANGRIFGSDSLFTGLSVGSQATATVTDSVYQGYEEFKTPTNFTISTTTVTANPVIAPLSQVATTVNGATNAFTAGPSDSLYNSSATPGGPTEGQELMSLVSFNITPNAPGTLSTSTSVTLTDTATGDTVIVYRANSAIAYTAGTTYTVTGIEQPFNSASEIVGVTTLTPAAAPEPGSVVVCVLGGAVLVGAVARRRSATARRS